MPIRADKKWLLQAAQVHNIRSDRACTIQHRGYRVRRIADTALRFCASDRAAPSHPLFNGSGAIEPSEYLVHASFLESYALVRPTRCRTGKTRQEAQSH